MFLLFVAPTPGPVGMNATQAVIDRPKGAEWRWTPQDDALLLGPDAAFLCALPEQTTGRAMVSRLHPDDQARHGGLIRESLRTGADFACASRVMSPGGGWHWVNMTGRTTRQGSRVTGIAGTAQALDQYARPEPGLARIFADIWGAGVAAMEERELELTRRLAAESANYTQREFLATVSHEIRNPLSVIFANIGLLRAHAERAGDLPALDRLSTLESAGRHLRDLVTDILDLAKAEAGHMEPDLAAFDLDQLLEEIEDMAITLTRDTGLMFLLDSPGDLGAITSDRVKLKQILLNLIGNAIKFTERGRVTLEVTSEAGQIVFEVHDTGPGIPEDRLELLFKAFSRVGGSKSPRAGGTGLGLYISERIARQLGGRLSVSSRVGEGSTFDLTLPRVMSLSPVHIPQLREEDRLVIGHTEDLGSLDPHHQSRNTNEMIARHSYDALVGLAGDGSLVPGLAASWRPLAEGHGWEFDLRRDVTFHDGSPFDGADVLASFARVRRSGSPFAAVLVPVVAEELPDPYRLILRTEAPMPLLPANLARLFILNRAQAETPTSAFDRLEVMNGTGPYRLTARPSDRVLRFARNDTFREGPQPWQEVEFRLIDESGSASIAALLAGEVDLIDNVTPEQLVELQSRTDVALYGCPTNRVWYLYFDQVSQTSPWLTDSRGQLLDTNPLRDVRVRRAISHAIDRAFICSKIMAGQAHPVGDIAGPGVFGTDPALGPPPYDPAGARALLAEAGWPDGFGITLHGSRDRSFNGATALRAIALMLNAIGIRARPEAMGARDFYARAARREFCMGLSGWGSVTGETSYTLHNLLTTRDPARGMGAVNRGGWSDPEFDALVRSAQIEMDATRRLGLLRAASARAMADVAVAPICFRSTTWATKRGIVYEPQTDGSTLAMATIRT
ncbi:ABC transporter substrate-binding protein [Oceanicola sp. 22II-s10i]|uniref:ABC transporter substrate-binding protein n=1 Tax=Oceanicola sp. 22II-s10i TaxID=1317116 RepID=UPI000B52406F|nr:ABC transporter substrate-binding protein [Oceanicola sp. 22II-s10i]